MERNLRLYPLYLVLSLEGLCHGVYVLWLVDVLNYAPGTVGLMLAAGDLALLVLEVPTGWLADRFGRRRSLLLGSLLQALGLALMWQGGRLVPLSFLLIAAGDAFRSGAQEALLLESCAAAGRGPEFPRRLADATALALAASVLLTLSGGLLVQHVGFHAAWGAEVALSLLGLATAVALAEPPRTPSEEAPERSGSTPWPLVVPVAVVAALSSCMSLLLPLALDHHGPALVALAVAGMQLAETAGAFLAGRTRAFSLRGLGLSGLASAALAPIPLAALAAAALEGAAWPRLGVELQRLAAPDRRATAVSVASAAAMAAKSACLPAASALHQAAGAGPAALGVAVLGAAAWALATLAHRSKRCLAGRTRRRRAGRVERRGRPEGRRVRRRPEMKKFFLVAGAVLLLATTACGSKTTTEVPGVGSVTTTEQGGQTQVTVTDEKGQTASIQTSEEGGTTKIDVQGAGGAASVDVSAGGANVSVSGGEGGAQVSVTGGEDSDSDSDEGEHAEGGEESGEKHEGGHGTVTMTGKEGSTTITASDKIDESHFSVPFYPGADVVSGGTSETTGPSGKTMRVAGAELVTKDPVDKVADFYTGKVKGANKMATEVNGEKTVVFVPANPMAGTTVTIVARDGATHITLASQGE